MHSVHSDPNERWCGTMGINLVRPPPQIFGVAEPLQRFRDSVVFRVRRNGPYGPENPCHENGEKGHATPHSRHGVLAQRLPLVPSAQVSRFGRSSLPSLLRSCGARSLDAALIVLPSLRVHSDGAFVTFPPDPLRDKAWLPLLPLPLPLRMPRSSGPQSSHDSHLRDSFLRRV